MARTDPNFIPPPGFQAIPYQTSTGPELCTDQIRLEVSDPRFPRGLVFRIEGPTPKIPALPLKGCGELWHSSWDIPTTWAIDRDNQCWANDAHSFPMGVRSTSYLLAEAEEYESRQRIRALLGMPREKPEWQVTAEQAGWIPPA